MPSNSSKKRQHSTTHPAGSGFRQALLFLRRVSNRNTMSQVNRSWNKTEVRSKIGDYIRGKISAQSLMHPSRINTKPIDKRRYNLNTGFHYEMTKTDYQRKTRRPPLKDYIEGKVKLSDMISPSKITFIPKEKKYQSETKIYPSEYDDSFDTKKHNLLFPEIVKITTARHTPEGAKLDSEISKLGDTKLFSRDTKSELTLIPIRTSNYGPTRKRKLMCKIRVQQSNAITNGETAAREHIIEIPERILRDGTGLPKFLMDRYNIPCYVNTGKPSKRKRQLAIEDNERVEPVRSKEAEITPRPRKKSLHALEYPVTENDNTACVEKPKESENTNADVENIPTEQGDHNNTTTYVFEFYEEEVPVQEMKTAIVEEFDDDHSHRDYGGSYIEDVHASTSVLHETPRSERFYQYDDVKSNIYFQRELIDLHREILKRDKNVMFVERSVNQVTASLNSLENVQNQEIKPIVMNIKTESDRMKTQIQSLQIENEELKKTLKYLRKKTGNYDKLIHYLRQNSNMKIQELENKLSTITQAQVKSIMMQNTVNKNIIQITSNMKRTYSEQESKHCCNSVKSHKHSNLTIS